MKLRNYNPDLFIDIYNSRVIKTGTAWFNRKKPDLGTNQTVKAVIYVIWLVKTSVIDRFFKKKKKKIAAEDCGFLATLYCNNFWTFSLSVRGIFVQQ